MDQPKVSRMLRLMKMMSGNVNYSIDELSEHLGMPPRTIFILTRSRMLDVDICNWAGVCRFYVGLADEIKIIDSPEFVDYVKVYLSKNLSKL